jgi:hypothetical protein
LGNLFILTTMAKGTSKNSETSDFRIQNKSMKLKMDIINIAANKGLTVTAFLRTVIIETRNSYPESMRQPLKDSL